MQRAGKMPALPEHCAETSSLSIWMRCLQRVVANRAARRDSEMNRGSPAFQAMMAGAMEQVGDADRGSRRRHLDPSKQRMVIHNGVRQEDFIDAAPPEIKRRSVIQGAPRANAREQPIVLAIPKTVNAGRMRIGGLGSVGTLLLVRGSGATCRLRCGRRVGIPGIGRLLLRLNRGYSREQKKCSRHREPHPFPHRKMFSPLVSRMGSTDCGQAWKGCKAGKKISPEIFFSDRPKRAGRVGGLATPPLGIVSFLLTPQERRRRIPATFSVRIWSMGPERFTVNGKNGASFHRGRKRAVFAGMDGAMH